MAIQWHLAFSGPVSVCAVFARAVWHRRNCCHNQKFLCISRLNLTRSADCISWTESLLTQANNRSWHWQWKQPYTDTQSVKECCNKCPACVGLVLYSARMVVAMAPTLCLAPETLYIRKVSFCEHFTFTRTKWRSKPNTQTVNIRPTAKFEYIASALCSMLFHWATRELKIWLLVLSCSL